MRKLTFEDEVRNITQTPCMKSFVRIFIFLILIRMVVLLVFKIIKSTKDLDVCSIYIPFSQKSER